MPTKSKPSSITRETIEKARDEFLNVHGEDYKPAQFNIQYSQSEGWRAEFMLNESTYNNCTLWLSGDEALELYETCDPTLVDTSSWESEYNEE